MNDENQKLNEEQLHLLYEMIKNLEKKCELLHMMTEALQAQIDADHAMILKVSEFSLKTAKSIWKTPNQQKKSKK